MIGQRLRDRVETILVAAIGRPGYVTADMVKPGATLIDVGINRLTDPADVQRFFPNDEPIGQRFCIDPTGKNLIAANQDGNSLVVFRIDQATGALTPTGSTVEVPRPVCVKMISVAQ